MTTWINQIANEPYNTAVSSAYGDISKIGREMGYQVLPMRRVNKMGEWPFDQLNDYVDGVMSGFDLNDTLIYQYPSWNYPMFDRLIFRKTVSYPGAKLVLFVLDVIPFQFADLTQLAWHVDSINYADVLVVSSMQMADWLHNHGVSKEIPIVLHTTFDFLASASRVKVSRPDRPTLAYVGNLSKISDLLGNAEFDVAVWNKKQPNTMSNRVTWFGEFKQKEMALSENYVGLVWTEDGQYKAAGLPNYGLFNNPYKLGLYLASGIPVIVQADSHAAEVVLKYNVGRVAGDLAEVGQLMNDTDWTVLRGNAELLRELITTGHFTKKAFLEVEQVIFQLGMTT
jgi:hypothetical protein